jgi:uncharacterized protein YbjT (DUF2867 family)
VVRWPYGAVETAPIDERDIAAVAVRALSEASLAGADFVLTGPEALSHARQVAVIGEVLDRRLAFDELTPDEFRREPAATWPPSAVEMLLAAWGGGGRASRVRDHDGGGPHRRSKRSPLPVRAQREEKLLQLVERLAHSIVRPEGRVESFLRGIELV